MFFKIMWSFPSSKRDLWLWWVSKVLLIGLLLEGGPSFLLVLTMWTNFFCGSSQLLIIHWEGTSKGNWQHVRERCICLGATAHNLWVRLDLINTTNTTYHRSPPPYMWLYMSLMCNKIASYFLYKKKLGIVLLPRGIGVDFLVCWCLSHKEHSIMINV